MVAISSAPRGGARLQAARLQRNFAERLACTQVRSIFRTEWVMTRGRYCYGAAKMIINDGSLCRNVILPPLLIPEVIMWGNEMRLSF